MADVRGGKTFMQCQQCGRLNAPGQGVCAWCGGPLLPARPDYEGAPNPVAYGPQYPSRYPAEDDEPIDGVWREEWPALGGAPSQEPLPPWLSSTNSAPSSRMPSSPFTNGAPAQQSDNWASGQGVGQGGEWDMSPAPPTSAPYGGDRPSQYPAYYGNDTGQRDQGGVLQQQMPPLFMVNPQDPYAQDNALAPYGFPPDNGLAPVGQSAQPQVPVRPPLQLAPTLSPGSALKNGRYRIIQRFAGGSPGGDTEPPLMVATDTELPSERVLLQELPLAAMHPEDAEYIRHGIVERLDNLSQAPGIAHLRDSFVEQRRHFLVFELPSGDRLIDRLRRAHGPLPEITVIGIILQILEILSSLERSVVPIIHGNITPVNVILRPGGQVTLVGISPTLLIYPTGQVTSGPAGALTPYSAPEQARGAADIRSDLYATCAVMHHAVTGAEPVGRLFPLARHANPAVSLELEDILGQGLRPSPGQRFQTPEALHDALAPLASGKRLTHVDEELDPDSPTGLRPLRDAQGRLVGPRQRLTQNPLFFVGIVLLLVAVLGGGVLYALQPRAVAPNNTGSALTGAFAPYYQAKGIGLSGGEFVFDTTQADYSLKQKGALALGSGDINGALTAYRSAVTSQPNDVEALIYAADLQILASKAPYVTVIAAVAFGADDDGDNAARYEMQGVYLAQQRFNQSANSPNHLRMRVMILNSGKDPADAQLASSLMLEQIKLGSIQHIVGIIGWPESNQSRLAIAALGASGMPVISPTASANHLEDIAGNFYSLVPSDSQQAINLADATANDLQAHRVLVVYDSSDQENVNVVASYSNRVITSHGTTTTVLGRVAYDGSAMPDASIFKSVAGQALSQNADLIYLVGNYRAAIYLADAVSQQANAANLLAPHILAGPQPTMAPFFGIGSDPAALAARSNPTALGLLKVATLASLDYRQLLNLAPNDARTFSDSFATLFRGFWGTGGLSTPDSLSILSYDATNMLIAALNIDLQAEPRSITIPTAQKIRVALGEFTAKEPFVGLGGAVGFTDVIHQPNKALGIYTLLPIPNAPDNAPIVQLQLTNVIGGKALFCGPTNCNPY